MFEINIKKLIVLIGITSTLSTTEVYAGQDLEPLQDKLYHLGGSTVLGLSANYIMKDWTHALGACLAVGMVKEVYDEIDYGGASTADMAYNIVGCAIGVGLGESMGIKMTMLPKYDKDGFMMAIRYDF